MSAAPDARVDRAHRIPGIPARGARRTSLKDGLACSELGPGWGPASQQFSRRRGGTRYKRHHLRLCGQRNLTVGVGPAPLSSAQPVSSPARGNHFPDARRMVVLGISRTLSCRVIRPDESWDYPSLERIPESDQCFAAPASAGFLFEVSMTATIINIADRRRRDDAKSEGDGGIDDGEILYASPPVKDTAPSEYVAQKDDPA